MTHTITHDWKLEGGTQLPAGTCVDVRYNDAKKQKQRFYVDLPLQQFLGNVFRDIRRRERKTQQQVAKDLKMRQSNISRIEAGNCSSLRRIYRLAQYYEIEGGFSITPNDTDTRSFYCPMDTPRP